MKLLDVASEQGWVRHTAGASALMKLRGPQRYKTDFEKALFLAQVGPIVKIPRKDFALEMDVLICDPVYRGSVERR